MTRIAILLATYNGRAFIEEQLSSIMVPQGAALTLYCSDDGSTDGTPECVAAHCARVGWTHVALKGPSLGAFQENFRHLILQAGADHDFYAYCDQDDIWLPDKLERALAALAPVPVGTPSLYCGRTFILEPDGRRDRMSPLFAKPPCFANAIVQSIAGGNTMLINRTGFLLLRQAAAKGGFVAHDWFTYQIISGAGGRVIYDPEPCLLYRQHDGNLIGKNTGWRSSVRRMWWALNGRFHGWNTINAVLIAANQDLMTPDSRRVFGLFAGARTAGLPARLQALWRSGAHRQTKRGQVSLWAGCLLKRL
ncbi:MAG: glycosyltransferase [Rhizobiaceae bacterium]|nr:glycosyltransferase [Rhizobiaceae bacterium]